MNIKNVIFVFVAVLSLVEKSEEHLAGEYLNYFQDIYFHTNISELTEKCSELFRDGNFTEKIYFDASAKLPEGIDHGRFFDLGNFDECYNHVEYNNEDTQYGKYCLGFMGIGNSSEFPLIKFQFEKDGYFGVYTGFCLSSHCTKEDFSKVFYKHSFAEERCVSKITDKKMTSGGYSTITLIAIIATMIICSTLYDMVLRYAVKEPAHPSLVIFSAMKNSEKVFATSNNPNQILCLNGIRSISMMWIISHHEFLTKIAGPIGNYNEVVKFFYTTGDLLLHQTPLTVDSFLTLAGILTAYTLMKKKEINLIECYIHRYFRLTPALMMMVLVTGTVYTEIGNGPLWWGSEIRSADCGNNWWKLLLYIQNYLCPTNQCVRQAWYLAVDMQCYVIAAVIMIFLKKWNRITLSAIGGLIFMSAIASFWISYAYALPTIRVYTTPVSQNYLKYYLSPTHTRCGPYLIGMICGYFIYNMKTNSDRKYNLSIFSKLLCWLTILTMQGICIFLPAQLSEDTVLENAFFNPIHRMVWSTAVCSIILLCETNNADFVNKFLSHPLFQVVARLSYCAYIVHPSIEYYRMASMKTVIDFSRIQLVSI
ncbi:hypothetical protein JTB14_018075 [Gonioctena quinquepunctata]|nr:hypothetical protein JTB14_018075 [Gonioctena quinquepunctata]